MDELGQLMTAAQAGDADAYARLLHAVASRVRDVVRRRRPSASREDVEDLVQDVLLSVHAARATYDPSRPFLPWLLALARYRMADAARRYARAGAHEVVVEDLDVTFSATDAKTPEEEYGDVGALRNAIRSLPPGQRQAIEQLKLQERSLKDTSAATGTSVAALKVATHRAMTALRKVLVPGGDIHEH